MRLTSHNDKLWFSMSQCYFEHKQITVICFNIDNSSCSSRKLDCEISIYVFKLNITWFIPGRTARGWKGQSEIENEHSELPLLLLNLLVESKQKIISRNWRCQSNAWIDQSGDQFPERFLNGLFLLKFLCTWFVIVPLHSTRHCKSMPDRNFNMQNSSVLINLIMNFWTTFRMNRPNPKSSNEERTNSQFVLIFFIYWFSLFFDVSHWCECPFVSPLGVPNMWCDSDCLNIDDNFDSWSNGES